MVDPLSLVIVTALTFLLAGFVKGVIGLGLPTMVYSGAERRFSRPGGPVRPPA